MAGDYAVDLEDWKEGLKKVSLAKLIRDRAQVSLAEAESGVDHLLKRRTLRIAGFSEAEAESFFDEANALGTQAEVAFAPGVKGVQLLEPPVGGVHWFRDQTIARFPHLNNDLSADSLGFHITMAAVAEQIRQTCKQDREDEAVSILEWLEELAFQAEADDEIQNAVCISFLEVSDLRDGSVTAQRVWAKAPQRLRQLLLEQEERYRRNSALPKCPVPK